jgi:hypothetical protein
MVEIPLTKGRTALVDWADADLTQYKWCVRGQGILYAHRKGENRTLIDMHRVILERMLNRPLGIQEFADHISGDTLDNRRSNLRLATRAENNQNAKRRKDNKTGYKGVSFRPDLGTWRARINVDNHSIFLGQFKTPEAAYAAYCDAAKKYHGAFARLD